MKSFIGSLCLVVASQAGAQTTSTSVASAPGGSATTVASTPPGASAPTATTTVVTSPKGTVVKTTALEPKSKLICQYTETVGTRLGGHKVCKTREEWRASSVEDRAAVDHAQVGRGIVGN